MIECSYTLNRDEGDITREFRSRKDMELLPNLVYIEGPNSSGKSTILHILALSLFGLHKENINPSLRNKMQSLINSNHQKLKFNVKISNKDGSLKLESTKENSDNPEIILYETKIIKRIFYHGKNFMMNTILFMIFLIIQQKD